MAGSPQPGFCCRGGHKAGNSHVSSAIYSQRGSLCFKQTMSDPTNRTKDSTVPSCVQCGPWTPRAGLHQSSSRRPHTRLYNLGTAPLKMFQVKMTYQRPFL